MRKFILKELTSNQEFKELWIFFIEKRFGSMARYMRNIFEKREKSLLFLLPDADKIDGNPDLLRLVESWIKFGLLERIKKEFPKPVSDEEFEISYLEAKEDFIALQKEKAAQDAALKERVAAKISKTEKAETEKAEYARMWTNQTEPEGKPINEQKFNELVKNKKGYKIFIIDRGEYEMGSVGEVYLNNDMILKQEDSGNKKAKKKKEKDFLTPYEYKLLVFTLKNKYRAGTVIELVEKCWGKKSLVEGPKGLRESLKKDKDTFMRETSTYRKTIANLSTLLNNKISVRLRSHKTGSYNLTGKPEFCLLGTII